MFIDMGYSSGQPTTPFDLDDDDTRRDASLSSACLKLGPT